MILGRWVVEAIQNVEKHRPSTTICITAAPPATLPPMAQLRAIESDDPLVGGFIVEFPSGTSKVITWRQEPLVSPALDGAKAFVAAMIEGMLNGPGVTNDDRRISLDDIERTNIPSLVASVWKIVRDWNAKRAEALYAANPEHRRIFGGAPAVLDAEGAPFRSIDHTADLARRLH